MIHTELTREYINEKGTQIRLTDSDSDLSMFSYISCNEECDDITKKCRGVIFQGEKLLVPSLGWTPEYTITDQEKITTLIQNTDNLHVFDSQEGCLLRVFWANEKWYIVTHRRLDAFKSKWSSKEYWGDMFKAGIEYLNIEWDKFFTDLDKTKIYFFLVRNNSENRIVCQTPENPTVFHVGTLIDGKHSFEEDIGIPSPQKHEFTTVKEMLEYIEKQGFEHIQGLIVFANNVIFKFYNAEYKQYLDARGNEASICFRYLQVRMNVEMRKRLEFLYPNFLDSFDEYETKIYETAKFLLHAYIARFARGEWKTVPKNEYEHIIRPCREWNLENPAQNKVTLNKVIDMINEQSPQFLNSCIRRLKNEEKRTTTDFIVVKRERLLKPRTFINPDFKK